MLIRLLAIKLDGGKQPFLKSGMGFDYRDREIIAKNIDIHVSKFKSAVRFQNLSKQIDSC